MSPVELTATVFFAVLFGWLALVGSATWIQIREEADRRARKRRDRDRTGR